DISGQNRRLHEALLEVRGRLPTHCEQKEFEWEGTPGSFVVARGSGRKAGGDVPGAACEARMLAKEGAHALAGMRRTRADFESQWAAGIVVEQVHLVAPLAPVVDAHLALLREGVEVGGGHVFDEQPHLLR